MVDATCLSFSCDASLELLKLDVGLDVGEELAVWAETFLLALPLSGEAVGELEEAFE